MIEVSIERNKVMGIVEGLSIIIAQKNGVASFESLWASKDERRKLDIYYREAIGDLEQRLMDWLSVSHQQFALRTDGQEDDYILKIRSRRFWPMRLQGLLGNKVQDYMVHSITASWLNDFQGLEVKSDYAAMAASDLGGIRSILEQREFGFDEQDRGNDNAEKPADDVANKVGERKEDDCYQDSDGAAVEARSRRKDNAVKGRSSTFMPGAVRSRHRDDAPVHHHHEETDWSGEGMEVMMRRPIMSPMGLMRPLGRPEWPMKTRPVDPKLKFRAQNEKQRKPEEERYTPTDDKKWYESLEEMGVVTPDHRGPDGVFMEKYRDIHEQEAMQEHDCGRMMMEGPAESDCGEHEELLDWG